MNRGIGYRDKGCLSRKSGVENGDCRPFPQSANEEELAAALTVLPAHPLSPSMEKGGCTHFLKRTEARKQGQPPFSVWGSKRAAGSTVATVPVFYRCRSWRCL